MKSALKKKKTKKKNKKKKNILAWIYNSTVRYKSQNDLIWFLTSNFKTLNCIEKKKKRNNRSLLSIPSAKKKGPELNNDDSVLSYTHPPFSCVKSTQLDLKGEIYCKA